VRNRIEEERTTPIIDRESFRKHRVGTTSPCPYRITGRPTRPGVTVVPKAERTLTADGKQLDAF
jgi:hypothetical protein